MTAVDDVDLDIRPGEIVGLMGPNGAGKTTVLDVLSGFVVPDSGTVALMAEDGTSSTCRRCRPTPGPCSASAAPSRTPACSPA